MTSDVPEDGYAWRPRLTPRRTVHSLQWLMILRFATAYVPDAHADTFGEGARAYAYEFYPRSAKILLELAEYGDRRAQIYICVMYLRGQGVPQNFKAAALWLHRAAEADVPAAQYFLGLLYDKGEGVPQDFVLAQAWLNLAIAHAEPAWRSRWVLIRDAVASKMSRADLAEAQRLALDWRPASPR